MPVVRPKIDIKTRKCFMDIVAPHLRLLFYRSGRSAGKSWGIAEILVWFSAQSPRRILWTREVQQSLRQSSWKLVGDTIRRFQLEEFFRITEKGIYGINGSEHMFAGLHNNADGIRSYEGIDVAVVEEAQTVSKRSIAALIPTIRKEDHDAHGNLTWQSKVVFSMNPRFEHDPAYELAEASKENPRHRVHDLHYLNNPFLPKVNYDDAEDMRRDNPREWAHVYDGGLLLNDEAQIYQNWTVIDDHKDINVPPTAKRIMGVDFGFSVDPVALVSALTWDNIIFITDEATGLKVENDDLPALFAGNDYIRPRSPRWQNPHGYRGVPHALTTDIIADNARPETISHCKKKGFRMRSAKKGPNSLVDGIAFIQSHKIYVMRTCERTCRELALYNYKRDKQTDEITADPEDKNNHCMDALRYATEPLRKAQITSGDGGILSMLRIR